MRKQKLTVWILIAAVIYLTGSEKNTGQNVQSMRPAGTPAVYDVTFTYTGQSLSGDVEQCPGGRVELKGTLVSYDEESADITYRGVLHLKIDPMVLCQAQRIPNADPPDQICEMRVEGDGAVAVDLQIDRGRAGWIKTESKGAWGRNDKPDLTHPFNGSASKVGGQCNPIDVDEHKHNIPDNTPANVFDGVELPLTGPLNLSNAPITKTYPLNGGNLVVTVSKKYTIR